MNSFSARETRNATFPSEFRVLGFIQVSSLQSGTVGCAGRVASRNAQRPTPPCQTGTSCPSTRLCLAQGLESETCETHPGHSWAWLWPEQRGRAVQLHQAVTIRLSPCLCCRHRALLGARRRLCRSYFFTNPVCS